MENGLKKRKSHQRLARGRIENITSSLRYLLRPHFGEFRVGDSKLAEIWPLMICKIHNMGSNMSEIRLSFVIIAKSYSTTSVIWHDSNCSESSSFALMLGRALVPVSLHPRRHGGVNLEMVYCFTFAACNYKKKKDPNSQDSVTIDVIHFNVRIIRFLLTNP